MRCIHLHRHTSRISAQCGCKPVWELLDRSRVYEFVEKSSMLSNWMKRSLVAFLAALFAINSLAPVVAQTITPIPRRTIAQTVPSKEHPPDMPLTDEQKAKNTPVHIKTEDEYQPKENATRLPSNPYKWWPRGDNAPYYIRTSPLGQFYECNSSISKYRAAVPKPEELMTCPTNQYPQKFLFNRAKEIPHPPVRSTPASTPLDTP